MDAAAYNQSDPSGLSYVKGRDVVVENRKQLVAKRQFMLKLVNLRVGGQHSALAGRVFAWLEEGGIDKMYDSYVEH